MFLSNLNFAYNIICFFETWLNDSNEDNSNYELLNNASVIIIKRIGFKYIFIIISNLKPEMTLALIVKILNQS